MESSLYQQQQHHQAAFIIDPAVYFYSSPIDHQFPLTHLQDGEPSNASYSCYKAHEAIQEADSSTSLDAAPLPTPRSTSTEKKRKESDESCLCITSQSKAAKENNKSRRKKSKAKELKETKATNEEAPSGYIHVRARRGQATDSHSLAERVRRERISERMKKLQGLVPGCDKVIGKALVLDEIINYVQSLQNQVEFLSMKLASANPICYEFDMGFEGYMTQSQEMGSISEAITAAIQSSHIPPTATNSPQQMVVEHQSAFPLHGQCPTIISQETATFLMQMGDHHKRGLHNQVELRDMCPFL